MLQGIFDDSLEMISMLMIALLVSAAPRAHVR